LLVVLRRRDEAGAVEQDYYLSNAPPEVLPGVLARVARAGHRVEKVHPDSTSSAGWSRISVSDYNPSRRAV